jgi:membrane-associated HD superfamily phosphohydrolase
MRNLGIYLAILAIIFEPLFIADYWNPPPLFGIEGFYAIEDFLFVVVSTGIAISIFNFSFSIKYVKKHKRRKKFSLLLSLGIIVSFLLLNQLFEYNSIFAFCYSVLMASLIIYVVRPDLILPSLFSGIVSMLIILSIYVIIFNLFLTSYWESYWRLAGTDYEYYILNIPWTEYLYYFSIGTYISILYDFASGTAKSRSIN